MSKIDRWGLERISHRKIAEAEAAVFRQQMLVTGKLGVVDIMIAESLLELMVAVLHDLYECRKVLLAGGNWQDDPQHRIAFH